MNHRGKSKYLKRADDELMTLGATGLANTTDYLVLQVKYGMLQHHSNISQQIVRFLNLGAIDGSRGDRS